MAATPSDGFHMKLEPDSGAFFVMWTDNPEAARMPPWMEERGGGYALDRL